MKRLIVTTILAAIGLSASALANPLPDHMWMGVKAGWYPSVHTPCHKICAPSPAEHEFYSVPALPNKRNYLCKARTKTYTPTKAYGWLFGNNFDSSNYAGYCQTANPFGAVQRHARFYCLCVNP